MDQQGTLNIQHTHTRTHIVSHTHMHTHTYNQFTKLGLRENTVTVISNNYDPKASTFQCQRLNSASSLSCVWVKTFYCSFWDPHSLSKDWSPWVKHLRVNYCGTSTGRPSGLLVLSCPWSKHRGVSKQSQAKITHSESYSCCGMQVWGIVDWLMGCSETGAGVQYYLNNHKIMSFSVPRPPTKRLSMFLVCTSSRCVNMRTVETADKAPIILLPFLFSK